MLKALKQIGKAICYVGLYFGMQVLVSFAATFVFSFVVGIRLGVQGVNTTQLDPNVVNQQVMDEVYSKMSVMIIVSGILALLFLWVFFVIRRKKITVEANLTPFAKKYWAPVLVGSLGLCLLINFGMQLLPIPEDVLLEYAEASQSLMEGPFILLFMANVIMAPLVEEILFRGLAFGRLRKGMPTWLALVLSSFLFGLMHGQILWVCYTTLVGLVLGFVAWRTNSTLAPMFMHFVFNLFGTCMGYFVESVSTMYCVLYTIGGALCVAAAVGLLWNEQFSEPAVKQISN